MARKTVTSTAVKRRYNKRHYDRLTLLCPIGTKEKVKEYATANGLTVNGVINEVSREIAGVTAEEWKPLYVAEIEKKEEAVAE